jgi:hypothetical protein
MQKHDLATGRVIACDVEVVARIGVTYRSDLLTVDAALSVHSEPVIDVA